MSLRYLDKGGTESYEVNSFPFGQTHVGFTNLYFKGYSSDGGERLHGKLLTRCKRQD
nr:MAG TPA: hypothetical protein [Microviridae sp.]